MKRFSVTKISLLSSVLLLISCGEATEPTAQRNDLIATDNTMVTLSDQEYFLGAGDSISVTLGPVIDKDLDAVTYQALPVNEKITISGGVLTYTAGNEGSEDIYTVVASDGTDKSTAYYKFFVSSPTSIGGTVTSTITSTVTPIISATLSPTITQVPTITPTITPTMTPTITPTPIPESFIEINWQESTQNTDGSELTDLMGYNIYLGSAINVVDQQYRFENSELSSAKLGPMAPGSYYVSVSSFNSLGAESRLTDFHYVEVE